jgi:hypothetical protein
MDKTAKILTDGLYQYGVELEVEDATFNFLSDRIDMLNKNKNMLQKYLLEASKLGMTKILVAVDDPHIDHEAERLGEQRMTSGSYDPIANRFTQSFAEKMKKKYKSRLHRAPWIEPAIAYLRTLHMLTNSSLVRVAPKMFKTFWTMANPSTGNPMGIMAMISLYENLISKMARILAQDSGTRTSRWTGQGQSSTPQTAVKGKTSKTPTKTFRNTKWFTNLSFDSNVKKHAGVSYLWVGERSRPFNVSGLKELSGTYYKARVKSETLKYFKTLKSNINLQLEGKEFTGSDSLDSTSYSFLSPSMIEMPNISLPLIAAAKTGKDPYNSFAYYSDVESNMLAFSSGISVKPGTSYDNVMGSFLSNFNATIMTVEDWEPVPATDHIAGRPVYSGVQQELDRIVEDKNAPKKIDPIENDDRSANSNSLYLALSKNFIQRGQTLSRSSNNNRVVIMNDYKDNPTAVSGRTVEVDSGATYDLRTTSNAVTWMAQDPEIIYSVLLSNGQPSQPLTIESALMTLPNQIKSLFLASTKPNAVTKKWYSYKYDFVRNLRTASAFTLNYRFIKRVDVLVGYKRSKGKRLIKEPVWKPLRKDYYQKAIGDGLLCRLRTYENIKFGITEPKGLKLPVYDEYFVLRPPRQQPSLGASAGLEGAVTGVDAAVGVSPETTLDPFDTGFDQSAAAYEDATDVAPVEATNSNMFDCGEAA